MRVIRSARCSLSEATDSTRLRLREVLTEYGRTVHHFIAKFGDRTWSTRELTKENLVFDTWLSARLRKGAAREAIDMVNAARERDGTDAHTPVHTGKRMYVSSTIASLDPKEDTTRFDAGLHFASIGRGVIMDLPVKFHPHYHTFARDPRARPLESYVVTEDSVPLAFEVDAGAPRQEGPEFGVDTGLHTLAALSDGTRLGTDLHPLVERIKGCTLGANGRPRARRALHQPIAEVAKEVTSLDPRLIVAEDLTLLSPGRTTQRRVSKNMRRSLGAWAYRDWLGRLRPACEVNRSRFEQVPPASTRPRCHVCGHTERANRKGEVVCCQKYGCAGKADVHAAKNLLIRFWGRGPVPTGPYGAGLKLEGVG